MKCLVCKAKLPEGASYCTNCNHYQSRLRNGLRFSASVTGFFLLCGSLIAFLITIYPEAMKTIAPKKDIEVIQITYSFRTSEIDLLNTSDDEIWVKNLEVHSNEKTNAGSPIFSAGVDVGLSLDPGEMKSEIIYTSQFQLNPVVIWNLDAKKWTRDRNPNPHSCHDIVFASPRHSLIASHKTLFGDKLKQMPAVLTLHYYYPRTREWLKKRVEVIGLLVRYEPCPPHKG